MDRQPTFFEKKIKPILQYVGALCAILTSIAYIVLVCVLIVGFECNIRGAKDTILFAVINAVIGLLIMMFLKIQGTSFAKNIPENKKIIDEYFSTKTKDKKVHSIKYYWTTSTIKDILFKGLSVCITTFGILYIVIQGSNDFTLLLLAIVNLIMFISFGMLSLCNAFDFYNNEHINYLKEELKNNENKVKMEEIEKCLKSMVSNLEILRSK